MKSASKDGVSIKGSWNLSLFGDFHLTDPEGITIRLPNRKVEGLLGILALNREYGIERKALAEILWPGKDGGANLRQTLSLLKRALGEDALETSRSHCRLSSEFRLNCDAEEEKKLGAGGFMPGHIGEWFDDLRSGEFDEVDDPTPDGLPISDFAKTLEWLAANSPANMYGVMREALHLTQGLSSTHAIRLLNIAGEDAKHANWRDYYLTYFGHGVSELEGASRAYSRVLKRAMANEDYTLAVESAYHLSATLLVQGNYGEAAKAVAACHFCATKVREPQLMAKASSIRGVLLMHLGNVTEGLIELEGSELSLGNEFAVAHAQALRAFMETSKGLHRRSLETVKAPSILAQASGHHRLGLMCSVTSSHAMAGLGNSEGSLKIILPEVENLEGKEASFFLPYAHEMAASAHMLCGDEQMAQVSLQKARDARELRRMPYTNLDRSRIESSKTAVKK